MDSTGFPVFPQDRAQGVFFPSTKGGPALPRPGAIMTPGDVLILGTGGGGAPTEFHLGQPDPAQQPGENLVQTAASQQLSFQFFQEIRYEELAIFQRRVNTVANETTGARRESFIEASRRVAARFEFSLDISVSALHGFAGAAETFGDSEGLDALTGLTRDLLTKTDEFFDEILTLFGQLLSGETSFEKIRQRIAEMFESFGNGAVALPGGSSGTQTQFQLEFEFSFSLEVSAEVVETDPIVLDLDGDGIELTSYLEGARFDITGRGKAVSTAFVTGGDAFLALDRNGNGQIDSGLELFGEQHGAANGFEELRKLDSNGDGVIDRRDAAFDTLRLFRDNGNGITDQGELITLHEAGVEAIDLAYRSVNEPTSGGNRITQTSVFRRYDGTSGAAADVMLKHLAE